MLSIFGPFWYFYYIPTNKKMGLTLNPVAFKYKVFLKDNSYELLFFSYCVIY